MSTPNPHRAARPLRIAYVSEIAEDYIAKGWSKLDAAEFDDREMITSIISSIESLGHTVDFVGNIEELTKRLAAGRQNEWDLVWNVAEGNTFHEGREAQVPGLLEAHRVPFTFSDAAVMTLSLNKVKTKLLFHYHGVTTAPFALVPRHQEWSAEECIARSPRKNQLKFPLFIKPACEGNSKGIQQFNKANDINELNSNMKNLQEIFPYQDMIIENYLDGREYTVLVIGTREYARVVGVLELVWMKNVAEGKCGMPDSSTVWVKETGAVIQSMPVVSVGDEADGFDFRMKKGWDWKGSWPLLLVKSDMEDPAIKRVADVALRAYRALDCFDCSRIDVRHDSWGPDAEPNVLEINTIPGMAQVNSCFAIIAAMNGYTHAQMIQEIIECAVRRQQIKTKIYTNGFTNGH